MSSTRKITLKSSDGKTFEIDELVAMESQTIKHVIEAGCVDDVGIPLLQVTSNILAKVIEYCKKHVEAASSEEKPCEDALNAWDTEFLKVDPATLMKLTLAVNYLNIKSLYDLTCKTIAYMMKNKPPEEIRETFNIVNDYTPEEEAEVRREHYRAFQ